MDIYGDFFTTSDKKKAIGSMTITLIWRWHAGVLHNRQKFMSSGDFLLFIWSYLSDIIVKWNGRCKKSSMVFFTIYCVTNSKGIHKAFVHVFLLLFKCPNTWYSNDWQVITVKSEHRHSIVELSLSFALPRTALSNVMFYAHQHF